MQALNTWESSSGGSYDFTRMGGIFQSLTLGIELKDDPAIAGSFLSFTGELRASYETLFGGQLKTTVNKSRTGETALEINVGVTGESWLRRWDEKTPPDTSGFTAEQTPGKVDGHRFMTFYLSLSRDHADKFFEEGVDRNWLQGSPNPSARALLPPE